VSLLGGGAAEACRNKNARLFFILTINTATAHDCFSNRLQHNSIAVLERHPNAERRDFRRALALLPFGDLEPLDAVDRVLLAVENGAIFGRMFVALLFLLVAADARVLVPVDT
jgi:hypothetical protein